MEFILDLKKIENESLNKDDLIVRRILNISSSTDTLKKKLPLLINVIEKKHIDKAREIIKEFNGEEKNNKNSLFDMVCFESFIDTLHFLPRIEEEEEDIYV